MTDVRSWIDDGSITANRAAHALPILIRQARAERPIIYKALSQELGMRHHRPVRLAAGYVGYTLGAIGRAKGWKRRAPPPLQSLVVNKTTGLPGDGVREFMSAAYRRARTKKQKEAALNGIYAEIYAYPYWEEVLQLLGLDPAPAALDDLVAEAVESAGRGGEGPEHRALKDFVAANPSVVGLRANHPAGKTEFRLASGDLVDVVFTGTGRRTAVEVKSRISGERDIARGLFQCLKYRAVLEAQAALSETPFDVSVVLVLGTVLPDRLVPLRNALKISVVDNVNHCG